MTGRSGVVVWFTGLPRSGKTTLAAAVARELAARKIACCTLDGDAVRDALVPRPGYTLDDRDGFYASLGNLAALLARQGVVVLVPATAHERRFRDRARAAAPAWLEIFVETPLDECQRREGGGVYRRDGSQVPGVGVAYEPPETPHFVARGGNDTDVVPRIVVEIARALARAQ